MASPTPPPPEVVSGPRITPGRVVLGLAVVGLVVMWAYVFSPWSRKEPPGTLDDPAFAAAAEPICASSAAALEDLRPARDTPTPEARALVIETSDRILAAMVTDLRAISPDEGADADAVGRWLDDWELYIDDREELAATLATGEDARLLETARGGDHISEALDFFAVTNEMPACATPDDVS